MIGPGLQPDRERDVKRIANFLFDPRQGDIEDDGSSPRQRSLLAMAGSLLAEISLPKLLFAWTVSIVLPAILLGFAPLVATAWLLKMSRTAAELTGFARALREHMIVDARIGFLACRIFGRADRREPGQGARRQRMFEQRFDIRTRLCFKSALKTKQPAGQKPAGCLKQRVGTPIKPAVATPLAQPASARPLPCDTGSIPAP